MVFYHSGFVCGLIVQTFQIALVVLVQFSTGCSAREPCWFVSVFSRFSGFVYLSPQFPCKKWFDLVLVFPFCWKPTTKRKFAELKESCARGKKHVLTFPARTKDTKKKKNTNSQPKTSTRKPNKTSTKTHGHNQFDPNQPTNQPTNTTHQPLEAAIRHTKCRHHLPICQAALPSSSAARNRFAPRSGASTPGKGREARLVETGGFFGRFLGRKEKSRWKNSHCFWYFCECICWFLERETGNVWIWLP